jgi:hypothetical protein
MGRSVRFFVFALLVVTTGARMAAQSHGEGTPAGKKEGAHGAPASTKEAHGAPASPKEAPHRATPAKKASPLGTPAHKDEAPRAPAPAATARAVASAFADAQARRRQVAQAQRNRQLPVPVEKRWGLVWQTPNQRVALVWPPTHSYPLSWADTSETPVAPDPVTVPAPVVRAGANPKAAAGRR